DAVFVERCGYRGEHRAGQTTERTRQGHGDGGGALRLDAAKGGGPRFLTRGAHCLAEHGFREHVPQNGAGQRQDEDDPEALARNVDVAYQHQRQKPEFRHERDFTPEGERGCPAQGERHADGQHHQRQRIGTARHRHIENAALHQPAGKRRTRYSEQERQRHRQFGGLRRAGKKNAAEHQEFAVGEIDQFGSIVHNGETKCRHAVNAADDEARDQDLQQGIHFTSRLCFGR
ncbi:hypothetical protein chiPu_0030550, partial [Chiloscyllium punctatum]|nr:hypothetical protein [Chiloscyllium punctatum]